MEDLVAEYGVWAIAFFVLGDDFGLPFFPPGIMLFAYSAMAKTHTLNLWPIIFIALTIPPFANYCLFFAGKRGLRIYLEHHGHKFYLPKHRIKKAEEILSRHGEKAIFFAACWSTIRPFCSLVAGSLGMNTSKFMFYHYLGVMTWATFLIGGGYYFGADAWVWVETNWKYVLLGLMGLIPAYFYWYSYFHKTETKKK